VNACVLAGGRATRLGGRAKPMLAVQGAPILERQLVVLAPRVGDILVAIAPGAAPMLDSTRVRFVEDAVGGAGPLAGIVAAASAAPMLVVAGDLPDLQAAVVDLLIAAYDDTVDAVVPRVRGLPEPLLAVYGPAAVEVARARLATGRRKAAAVFEDPSLRIRWIEEAALRAVDPQLRSLDDIDTPDDLERWRDH
jgi:molybdopterin-guanine dinucleotide biosynthesis protein A